MAALGTSDPFRIHGVIVLIYSGVLLYFLSPSLYAPEPQIDRQASYYDEPIKVGIFLSMAWAVFGMFMGVWVAAQLAWPDLAFDAAWSTFGRMRPTHTTRHLRFRRQCIDRHPSMSSSEPRPRPGADQLWSYLRLQPTLFIEVKVISWGVPMKSTPRMVAAFGWSSSG